MKTSLVQVVGGRWISTLDNPANLWVRSLVDGQFYRAL